MKRKSVIIIFVSVIAVILLAIWIVPIIKKQIVLNGINKQIHTLEKSKEVLSGEINQLSLDRQKCEELQISASDQAAGKRGEIVKIEGDITSLKLQYNQIAGFTQG